MNNPSRDILIVDDDSTIVDLLVNALEEAGHAFSVAYDGASALLAMEYHPPALVLLDLHMPGLGGQEVMGQLWWYGLTQVPVIVMTADERAAQALAATGAAEYILKPFSLDTLLRRVAYYVESDSSTPSAPLKAI